MARTRFIQAINDAIREEMERGEKVIRFREDVEASIFGDTRGLIDVFGPRRVRNTPISENTLTGMTVGAAASGYRVVLHLMFAKFIYTGMDGIANQMARARLMFRGQIELPITIIASYGGGRANAAQHSDTPFAPVMNVGGVHLVIPANPADAKGLLKSAIRCNDPVIFLEPGGRGGELGDVPDEEYLTPIGQAAVLREGSDVALLSWHVKPGQSFFRDDVLYEIDTEKVAQEVAAPVTGKLVEILVEEDSEITVGDEVCNIETEESIDTNSPQD